MQRGPEPPCSPPAVKAAALVALSALAVAPPARADGPSAAQRFLDAHAANLTRYCSDAVTAGEVFMGAVAGGYATEIKIGAKVLGWLGCQRLLPAMTGRAQAAVIEASFRADPRQSQDLADIPDVAQRPVELARIPVTPEQAAAINALPATSIRPLGSYGAVMRQIDPNWTPPPPPATPQPGAWQVDLFPPADSRPR